MKHLMIATLMMITLNAYADNYGMTSTPDTQEQYEQNTDQQNSDGFAN